jgi:hypothetical protein
MTQRDLADHDYASDGANDGRTPAMASTNLPDDDFAEQITPAFRSRGVGCR